MRKLVNAQNVDSPDADYPKGRPRNKTITTPGTIFSEELMGDIIQLFQKLIIDAGIAENDLPDNVTNGYQLLEAFDKRYVKSTYVEIGGWNMQIQTQITVASPVASNRIIGLSAMINNDAETGRTKLTYNNALNQIGGALSTFSDLIALQRGGTGSFYDDANYTDDTINRGYVVISYI